MTEEFDSNDILDKFPFLGLMHPAHIRYMREPSLNSLEYFFGLIEKMDIEKRDKIFDFTYTALHLTDENRYELFKNKIQSLSTKIFDHFLIVSIVNYTLIHIFDLADKTNNNNFIKEQKKRLKFVEEVKAGKIKVDGRDLEDTEGADVYCEHIQKSIDDLPERTEKFYELYIYFCDTVVSKLFNESPFDAVNAPSDRLLKSLLNS